MEYININRWKRKEHFNRFRNFKNPNMNVCANVEITNLYNYSKEKGFSINTALIYVATKVCNQIDEFRYRIRNDEIVLHDTVNPCFTAITKDNLCSFVNECDFSPDFDVFLETATKRIKYATEHIVLTDAPFEDDVVYLTTVPWISITSVSHPVSGAKPDGIPRIVLGGFIRENNKVMMPLSVEVHHGLADGYHLGEYYKKFEEICQSVDL